MNVSVIGGGSWGTAFALYLGRNGFRTRLWVREPEIYEAALRERENKVFLPGFKFPPEVSFHHDIEEAGDGVELIFAAVPAQFCRKIYGRLASFLGPGQSLISLTKGVEKKTLCRMTQIMAETFAPRDHVRCGVLSGPSFSREVAEGHPTALVLAAKDPAWAENVQHRLSSQALRIYTSRDVVGVEIAGALKNIVAIAAGVSDSLGFGDNARAALMTRGLAEMTRLGLALGAQKETFSGLAGIGDLVLTCTGRLSRNRFVGSELGKGKSLASIIAGMRMVAEGIATTLSARELARREGVEMPIFEQVYQILYNKKDPRKALADLMSRSLKEET
jgi:glycerol-3-phosphate dehydrogenase (NAD(P)+)